jgi:hypothetical protein
MAVNSLGNVRRGALDEAAFFRLEGQADSDVEIHGGTAGTERALMHV